MAASAVLYHPVVVFTICMLAGWGVYAFGRALAPASRVVGGKLKTYACGENVEGDSFPTAFHLYHAAYLLVGLIAIIILFKD